MPESWGRRLLRAADIACELSIPAIKGVGDGIVRFIDGDSELARLWDVDFKAVKGNATFVGVGPAFNRSSCTDDEI